jgi:hypothetical protein
VALYSAFHISERVCTEAISLERWSPRNMIMTLSSIEDPLGSAGTFSFIVRITRGSEGNERGRPGELRFRDGGNSGLRGREITRWAET